MVRGRRRGLTLVTGFPQYTARRLVACLARVEPAARLCLLVPERHLSAARRFLATLPGGRGRCSVLEGETSRMDLGLSGAEWNDLRENVSTIHHMAAVFHLGVDRRLAEEVNVDGTAEVLELARSCERLERLVFYSTVGVSGTYQGVWTEEDLDRGQRFNNHYEETKFLAERLLRSAGSQIPLTIIRSPVIVGDSRTGEIDKLDGPYQLMLLFVALPLDLGVPLPGRATRLVNLIPVDFFAEASCVLARHPEGLGRTFHVVDPEPLPMSRVFDLVARASGSRVPSGYIPSRLTRALMRTPGLERFAESPVAALDLFTSDVVYASAGAQELLREAGVVCPRFETYVEGLVAFLKRKIDRQAGRRTDEEVYDPLW